MKQALQDLILKIKEIEDQCELRVAPNWVTFLQINEYALSQREDSLWEAQFTRLLSMG